MSFTEDLTPYFADWGVSATIGAATVTGIFDSVYQQALGLVAGSSPQLVIRSADAGSVANGSAVTVAGTSYTVTAIEPDGTGLTILRLQEA